MHIVCAVVRRCEPKIFTGCVLTHQFLHALAKTTFARGTERPQRQQVVAWLAHGADEEALVAILPSVLQFGFIYKLTIRQRVFQVGSLEEVYCEAPTSFLIVLEDDLI